MSKTSTTMGPKSIWDMKKAELQTELNDRQIRFPEKATVPELRDILKDARGPNLKKDPMTEHNSKSAAELKLTLSQMGLSSPNGTKGSMLRTLRDFYENQTPTGQSIITFGKKENLTFEEVMATDTGYCAWTINEFMQHGTNCDPGLRRFARWLMEQGIWKKQKDQPTATPEKKEEVEEESLKAQYRPLRSNGTSSKRESVPMPKMADPPNKKPEVFAMDKPPVWDGQPESLENFMIQAQLHLQHENLKKGHQKDSESSSSWTIPKSVDMRDATKRREIDGDEQK